MRRGCTFASQGESVTVLASTTTTRSSSLYFPGNEEPFAFLRYFTDPSVQMDRLAIGKTAEFSVQRNLEMLYSHLEHALMPVNFPAVPFMGEGLSGGLFDEAESFSPNLLKQLNEVLNELVQVSKSMASKEKPLDMLDLTSLFTAPSLFIFISVFFHSLHWHLPVVHFPTFDPGNISNILLLAICLTGASYTTLPHGTRIPPSLLDVAEELIFRELASLSTISLKDPTQSLPIVQVIQSALIIEMLQFGQDRKDTRRRIRIFRHPCLVSVMRSFGFFQLRRRMAVRVCDDHTWREMVAEEVCIRLACWVFLADGFLTVCFKNHPSLSSFEMNCDFSWPTALWEADSAASFNNIVAADTALSPSHSFPDALGQLLSNSISDSIQLSVEHLLMLIYAINILAFQARAGLLAYLPLKSISNAAQNWKKIWDGTASSLGTERSLLLGYPQHAEELWRLVSATLDMATRDEGRICYLDGGATDDLDDLHGFIQYCASR
ncbi:hypothetical protein AWENTII_007391 [Aspergillus wentii]